MKRTTRDGTRIYAQSARAYNRSTFIALVRLTTRNNLLRGEVDPGGRVWFYTGAAPMPIEVRAREPPTAGR